MGWTHPETTVHALTPRHRRKAGSGPPANALIAWIRTDPYLRDAATTVSHRREIDLPLLFDTRSAKAAVAACFVLACAAVMGITEIVSHGRAEAQPTSHPASRPVIEPESVPLDRAPAEPGALRAASDGSGNQAAKPPMSSSRRSAAGVSSNPARGPAFTQGSLPTWRSARRYG